MKYDDDGTQAEDFLFREQGRVCICILVHSISGIFLCEVNL